MMKEFDFSQNQDEVFVYKKVSGGVVMLLILYVDDILLMGNNISMLHNLSRFGYPKVSP